MEGKVAPSGRRTLTPAILGSVLFAAMCALVAITFVAGRGGLQMPVAAAPSGTGASAIPTGPVATLVPGSPLAASPATSPAASPVPTATPSPPIASTAPSSVPSPSAPPTVAPSFDPLAALPPCPTEPGCYEYVIKRGDTLSSVASRYLVPVSTVLALNPELSDPSTIVVGQVLYLGRDPFARLEPCPDAPDCSLYTVRPGDLLSTIAGRFALAPEAILAANPSITDPNAIFSGQVIRLPRLA